MKRLFLLRHAQTLPAEGGSDIERKLTPDGIADAGALGHVIRQKNFVPDLIYCSPAQRTQETLENLALEAQTEKPQILYDGSQGDYFHLIQNTNAEIQNLMLIAHNPSIHALAALLASEENPTLMGRLVGSYPPGTLTALGCRIDSWSDLQPGENMLLNILEPLDYNA